MAWSWNGIEFTVEMAFGDAPLAASYTYTDVSAYVRGVPNIFRGKTSELDDLSPGYCTIILGNLDRRFDPDYTSGAYYPDVVPMVPVRLQATFNSVTYTVLTGFVLGWRQVEDATSGDLIVEAQCVDGTRFMRNNPLAGSAYEDAVLADDPIYYWPDPTLPDLVARVRLGAHENDSVSSDDIGYPVGSVDAFAGAERVSHADLTLPKSITFWCRLAESASSTPSVRIHVDSTNYVLVQAMTTGFVANYSNSTDTKSYDTPPDPSAMSYNMKASTVHHVAVTFDTTSVVVYLDGQQVLTDTLTSATNAETRVYKTRIASYDTGATTSPSISHVAAFSDTLSAAEVYAQFIAGHHAFGHPTGERGGARIGRVLDEIGWPAGRRDLDAGATRQAPYQPAGMEAIDYIRQVETGEQGMFFFDVDGNATFIDRIQLALAASVATFSDDGAVGAIKYQSLQRDGSHVDTIANIVTTSYSDVGAITRRDATSIAAYDSSRKFIDAPTIPDGKTASNCSAYALRLGKDPASRIQSLTAPMRIDTGDNEADKLLALELGDKVVVERTPGGVGSQVVKTLIVQGIQHEIDLEQWMVTIYASPAPPAADDVPYFQVGDATYGKVGAAFGNAVIY